jgi:hypothetical protein
MAFDLKSTSGGLAKAGFTAFALLLSSAAIPALAEDKLQYYTCSG